MPLMTWVADGFAKYHFRVRAECLLDFFLAVVWIDEGAVDAEFLQGNAEEVEGATVDLIGGNDVVASLADVEYGIAPDLIRLSVGIEDVEDILDDIKQALDKIK